VTDNQWLKQHITNPSEDELYFFVERVGMILETDFSEIKTEDARKQAFEELKTHDF